MNNNFSKWGWGFFIGIIAGIFIGSSFGPSKDDYKLALGQCEIVRDDYSSALEDAASSIEEANSQISDAQWYAWSSYEEMGETLDNLYEVNDADNPSTFCY